MIGHKKAGAIGGPNVLHNMNESTIGVMIYDFDMNTFYSSENHVLNFELSGGFCGTSPVLDENELEHMIKKFEYDISVWRIRFYNLDLGLCSSLEN
uniref:Uncharacterized protein n=1 Tax=Salix viminalis TaxID=40686 RepID=A0A6N2MZD4_SALVM